MLTDTTFKREQHFFYMFSVTQNRRFSYAHMRYYLLYWTALASVSSIVLQHASTTGIWKANRRKLFISNYKINTLTLQYKGAENNVLWAEAVLGEELSFHMCPDLQTMFSNWFTSSVLQYSFLLPPQLEISHGKGAKLFRTELVIIRSFYSTKSPLKKRKAKKYRTLVLSQLEDENGKTALSHI